MDEFQDLYWAQSYWWYSTQGTRLLSFYIWVTPRIKATHLPFSSFFFLLCFLKKFYVCSKICRYFPFVPWLHTCMAFSIINITCQDCIFFFLPKINLHWHMIIFQSLQFTLCFTLDVIQSIGLDKYMITCIHNYNIMYSIFPALKTSVLCLFISQVRRQNTR